MHNLIVTPLLKKLLIGFFVGLSLLLLFFTTLRIMMTFALFDFNIYYQASKDVLAGRALYHNSAIDNNYPPTALVFMLPVSFLPQNLAENIWTIGSVLAMIWSVWILSSAIDSKQAFVITLLSVCLAIWMFPVKFTFGLGQINFLLLLFLCLSFSAGLQKQQFLAGWWLGLAAAIKITPLILLLYFFRKGQWRVGLWCAVTFGLLHLWALYLVGAQTLIEYYTRIFPHIPTIGNAAYYNQAFSGFLAREAVPTTVSYVANYGIFILLGLISWRFTKSSMVSPTRQILEYSLFILTSLIGAGLAWQHHFVWTLPVFVVVVGLLVQRKIATSQLLWFICAYLLIGANSKHPAAVPVWATFLLSHVLYGAMIVFWQVIGLLKSSIYLTDSPSNTHQQN